MIYKNMKIKVEKDEHGESNLDEIVGGSLKDWGIRKNTERIIFLNL